MYLKKEVFWTNENGVTRQLSALQGIRSRVTFEPSNDNLRLSLIDDESLYQDGKFRIKEGDRIDVFIKMVKDNIDVSMKGSDMIWSGIFLDYNRTDDTDNQSIDITVTSLSYEIFNRFWNQSYANQSLKTNEIIADILQNLSENVGGTGDYNVTYSMVEYPSREGIQSTRSDGSDFPIIEPVYTQKPMYEWLQELSSPLWTNTDEEIPPVQSRKMVFRIDGDITNNKIIYNAKWFYPVIDNAIILSSLDQVISINGGSTNEDSVNLLYLDCGEDFNGRPIKTQIFDQTHSAMPIIKERYEHKVSIGGLNNDYQNEYNSLRQKYYPGQNQEFRNEVTKLARSYADYWFKEFGRAKPKLTITIPFQRADLGSYIYLNLPKYPKGYYFIEALGYNITESEATTILDVFLDDDIN